jgi:beta-ketoacyl-acyl-carrier-protein synthase II
MPKLKEIKRVVITGMGVISPLGNTLDDLWQNLMAGKSGIGFIESIPPEERTCTIGGECKDFNPEQYMDKKEARRMDRYCQFAFAAAKLAMAQSGIKTGDVNPHRFGVVVSSAAGGIGTIEEQLKNAQKKGYARTSPFLVPMMISDISAGRIAIEYQAKGPNMAVVTACATGSNSIGEAFRMIQYGDADVMLAGGAESPITPLSVAGFTACKAVSMGYADTPEKACRPFDVGRDGFVMSEGAAILVLEELEHAKARGAMIYGELAGYGRTADAYDIVSPCDDGDGAARAMQEALKDAELDVSQIQYLNAHATSTPLGDIAETKAIKTVFGEHAKRLTISATKSMHGHMLGAAGSLEAVVSLLAIQYKMIPPTINLDNPDPECDLDYTPNTPKALPNLTCALSNSFGFGGHNAALIFKEYTA